MKLTPDDLTALFPREQKSPAAVRKPGGILAMLRVRKPAPPPPTRWQRLKRALGLRA